MSEALSETICLKYTSEGADMTSLVKRYNIEQFPAIVLAMPNGDVNELLVGFIPPEPLLDQLQRVHSLDNTVTSHRLAVEAQPDDLGAQYALAQKLASCWDWRNFDRTVKAIRRADPNSLWVKCRAPSTARWRQRFVAESSTNPLFRLRYVASI
ncbi:MAG: hypothetical protein ACI9EF_003063 [Pseudohongiellaceae bacterium]